MLNNRKKPTAVKGQASAKAPNSRSEEQVRDKVGKVVKDFYNRHGAAMTVLANE